MSKAMEALERIKALGRTDILCFYESCNKPNCVEAKKQADIIRDYITTTEAELENARDVIEEFGAHVEIGSIGHFSAQDAIDGINKAIGPDKKAARIKELEEALDNAQKSMDAFARGFRDDSVAAQWARGVACDLRKALDGARKVEP